MVFSSLIFIYAFLTPQLILCLLIRNTKAQNVILLFFSLVFYAFGGPEYLLLLLGESFIAFYTAKNADNTDDLSLKKRWVIAGIAFLLILLILFKYLGFLLTNFKNAFGWPDVIPEIVLPIGISFYTFQLISYIVDVYRKEVPAQSSYWKILLYASLFHQCIAGPIVRYQTVANEIENRSAARKDIFAGIRRFSIGLAKKAILANGIAVVADSLLPMTMEALTKSSATSLTLGMLAYMLQIYLDFSAYSDMAIGMGRMMGFHYLENFNYPYSAFSVQDFWRRWHISLSTFFRDYVYIPLGGNRKGFLRTVFNLFVVWALTGFWHGASWNYILWGLYFFVFLFIEKLFLGKLLERNKATRIIGRIYTLAIVFFGWILFKFEDLNLAFSVIRGIFGIGVSGTFAIAKSTFVNNIFLLLFCILACLPVGRALRLRIHKSRAYRKGGAAFTWISLGEVLLPAFLLLIATIALIGDSYNPFLYFQF